ncbi:CHAT domain-containing protein [Limnobacter thiooxidans]|nr:CHAT domain-containing protein [Limnobacter thiooxidans]
MSTYEPDKKRVQGFDPIAILGNGFTLGGADLVTGGSLREVVGRMTAALLLALRDKKGGLVFPGGVIFLPPSQATMVTHANVFSALLEAIQELRGSPVDTKEEKVLRRIVKVQHTSSLEVGDLIREAQGSPERSFIVVAEASRFRDPAVKLPVTFGATATRLPEDNWTPHVASLCRQLVSVVKRMDSYAFVHVPELPARNPINQQQLMSIDDCGVVELTYEGDIEQILAHNSELWLSMAVQGRLHEVETQLDNLKLSTGYKFHTLVQLVNRTGNKEETLAFIKRFRPYLPELPSEVAIQVSHFAANAGDIVLAQELLPNVPNSIRDPMWLEEGLEVATQLEDNDRIAQYDARLEILSPHSERLRENRDRRLLMNCRDALISEGQRFTTAGFTIYHLELQRCMLESDPDYDAAIKLADGWGQEWWELAVVCCAIRAESLGFYRDAANAACLITSSKLYGRQATQVLLASVKAMMLRELVPKTEYDVYRVLFKSAFQFLASHPSDYRVRSSLTSLLSVEACGDLGMPIVASSMLALAERGITLSRPETERDEFKAYLLDNQVRTSITNAFKWMDERGIGEPGVTVIPRELILAPPDDVVAALKQTVLNANGVLGEDADLTFLEKLVFIVCAVCPHAIQERDCDIELMRLLASQFAISGQFQRARDFAEQILLMGQRTVICRRLAWGAFADIHHRCHNHVTALVGSACALATDAAVQKEDLWQEVYVIHRTLRDLGLFELAQSFLIPMKKLREDLGFDPSTDFQIIAADLGLQLMQADEKPLHELQELLTKIAKASEDALEHKNRLFPLAVLLGQIITKVKVAGGVVAPARDRLLKTALQQVGLRAANTIRTMSTDKPTALEVLALFNEVERATFVSDIACDYAYIEIASRRLLGAGLKDAPIPSEAAFAVELLSDHTLSTRSKIPPMTVEWATQYAYELNDLGYSVVFMALDNEGELSVINVADRQVCKIEQQRLENTFQRRFEGWLEEFPKGYGTVDRDEGNNIFYLTMEQLAINFPEADRLIVVAEPALQQLTTNLVVMRSEVNSCEYLAGTRISIGMVPSLTWLAATRAAPRARKIGYKAWVSAQSDEVPIEPGTGQGEQDGVQVVQTLDVALGRLKGSFEEFGFSVNTGRRLPAGLGDASLAVVIAHGGLSNEGRYLRSIRDDYSLIESPSALANAIGGTELVVLFVCSGGRIDKNPWNNSTTSLPKQLLNCGSRAVVASPWPLSVIVTHNWLDPFLRAWEVGETVLEATRKANDEVARKLGDVPQYSLAMQVYGDVLLTRSAGV